jgi:pescadillo
VRKLQISLAEFRRLCILKGIYPRQPKSKKKASGNNNNNNTFYLVKDIQFLMHEPLLNKLREERIFVKKLQKALAKKQESVAKVLQDNKPFYTLDHLVKERYGVFPIVVGIFGSITTRLSLFVIVLLMAEPTATDVL